MQCKKVTWPFGEYQSGQMGFVVNKVFLRELQGFKSLFPNTKGLCPYGGYQSGQMGFAVNKVFLLKLRWFKSDTSNKARQYNMLCSDLGGVGNSAFSPLRYHLSNYNIIMRQSPFPNVNRQKLLKEKMDKERRLKKVQTASGDTENNNSHQLC